MKITNVADHFVETLNRSGVKRIFGVVGDSLNGLTESLRQRSAIDWIHVRHEEVAAFAAAGEAQVTGELAVCAGSLRARQPASDQRPVRRASQPRAGAGDRRPHPIRRRSAAAISRRPIRRNLFRECSHYCELVSDPASCPMCWKTPSARPSDSAAWRCWCFPATSRCGRRPTRAIAPRRRPIARGADRAPGRSRTRRAGRAAERRQARHAVLRSRLRRRACRLMRLAETLKSPIVHALGGKEHVEYDNPYDVGMTGFIGFSSGYAAMHACDVLLMLGTDFPYKQFLPTRRQNRPGRYPAGKSRPALQAGPRSGRRRRRHDRGAAAQAHRQDRPAPSRRQPRPLREGARRPRRTRRGHAGPQADPSAISRAHASAKPPRKTRSSPPMSARRRSGPRAI